MISPHFLIQTQLSTFDYKRPLFFTESCVAHADGEKKRSIMQIAIRKKN